MFLDQIYIDLFIKLISYLIIVGSGIVKIPQIIKILRSKSTKGISSFGIYIEILSSCIYSFSNFRFNVPWLLWADSAFIGLQNLAILILCIRYSKDEKNKNGIKFSHIFYLTSITLLIAALYQNLINISVLKYLSISPLIFVVLSRVPQIVKCYIESSTGQLSFISFFLLTGGSWSRVATVLFSESKSNNILLLTNVISALLNTIPLMQIIIFKYCSTISESSKSESKKHSKRKID
ncbi:MPU1p [Cryptosporidium xiaoi]|uniref:Mannose-P-dolichol utilization defect 1 protein homolog n=1 Tax=Cryptosporidium xiaoi TaxID=659607 RepID=A0AAV9XWC7_9CRYT